MDQQGGARAFDPSTPPPVAPPVLGEWPTPAPASVADAPAPTTGGGMLPKVAVLSAAAFVVTLGLLFSLGRETTSVTAEALRAGQLVADPAPEQEIVDLGVGAVPRPIGVTTTVAGMQVFEFDDPGEAVRVVMAIANSGVPESSAVDGAYAVGDGWYVLGMERWVVAFREDDLPYVAAVVGALVASLDEAS